MHNFDDSIEVEMILAGKLRRYHSLSIWRQLLRPVSIVLPNLRDGLLIIGGFFQSLYKLIRRRPDVVFTKGGYVCLPVGLAAKLLRIPLVIHDSDAHPGLTNRVLSRFAEAIATGAPLKYYPYDPNISRYVGIPIASEFKPFSSQEQLAAKQQHDMPVDRPLVVVTGGGLGARRINESVARALDELLELTSVVLISGSSQYDKMRALTPTGDERFKLEAFVSSGMASLLGAADIVVTRAGATTILELAALAKPTILIPNRYLTGGHQLKNAAVYAESGAVEILDEQTLEADPNSLVDMIRDLLGDQLRLREMGRKFSAFAKPAAASDMADMILSAAKGKKA